MTERKKSGKSVYFTLDELKVIRQACNIMLMDAKKTWGKKTALHNVLDKVDLKLKAIEEWGFVG